MLFKIRTVNTDVINKSMFKHLDRYDVCQCFGRSVDFDGSTKAGGYLIRKF